MDAPVNNLIRCTPFILPANAVEARSLIREEGDGKLMVGYPIVFDTWTEINSWEGKFRESIVPGAVKKTLKESGDRIVRLFNHGFEYSTGDKPIAADGPMTPDERGLWTESPWIDRPYADDVRELVSAGAIKGMSFRFSVVKEEWDDEPSDGGLPMRTIKELRLFEFGPVTYPAYQATTVGVRSASEYADWLRNKTDDEAALTSGEAERTSDEATDVPPNGAPVVTKAHRDHAVRKLDHYLKELHRERVA